MNGFLLIDKPEGLTSFDCIRKLRKALDTRRMGFVGTLDPLATGLMIFAVGEATKLIPYLEGLDKVYHVTASLGAVSNTYDADGEVEELKGARKPSRSQIEELLEEEFTGELEQVPPPFSAVHVEGKRAYQIAREGARPDLKPRVVSFYDVKLHSYAWPLARITVHCGSGTYVRSFVHDLGQALGCGAYVKALRRTRIGTYSVKDALALDRILSKKVRLISPRDMFPDWQSIELNEERFRTLWNGGFVENFAELKKGPALGIYKNVCIGVLEVRRNGQLKLERRLNVLP